MRRRPGPPPQTSNVRELRGNPGKRPNPPSLEAPVASGPPLVPPLLIEHEIATREWHRTCAQFIELGTFADVDLNANATACLRWEQFEQAEAALVKLGRVYANPQGALAARPEVKLSRDASTEALSIWERFGMTPAGRSRILVKKDDGHQDPLEALLQKREQAKRQA